MAIFVALTRAPRRAICLLDATVGCVLEFVGSQLVELAINSLINLGMTGSITHITG